MGYSSLQSCLNDLHAHGHLITIKEEVNPYLEMAAMQMLAYRHKGPALLFEQVKGSSFRAVSNLFGSIDRSRFMFRDTYAEVKKLIRLKNDPLAALKQPLNYWRSPFLAWKALPKRLRIKPPIGYHECYVRDLPLIHHWPKDGGAFVTLPVVYTEDPEKPGIMSSNVGMYRIQLNGNQYETNKEVGLHYQLHRGIGVHQTKWNQRGENMKVSVFVGGPPALIFAGVMPLPEGISELTFAGALGGRRFRYFYDAQGYCVAADADFVITGNVRAGEVKPEGPFGDHLGYYSLQHPFPLMHLHKVYHRPKGIWAFTLVGRPPQEDTSFGELVHDLTGEAVPAEIPGLHAVHAVDAAGVHPLLLAIGSERYTPYLEQQRPAELLTLANHILGFGQLSLAKYLWIANKADNPHLDVHHTSAFFEHMLERLDLTRDLHFYTQTSIDTLDYSGDGLNTGSKLVLAAVGKPIRHLSNKPPSFQRPASIIDCLLVGPGILALSAGAFQSQALTEEMINDWSLFYKGQEIALADSYPLWVLCDDPPFLAMDYANFVWVCFTRSNPSHDIYGIGAFTAYKHWGCKGPLIIDARRKPHHAPELVYPENVLQAAADKLCRAGLKL